MGEVIWLFGSLGFIQEVLSEQLERLKQVRLSRESAKLSTTEEQAMAEEGMGDAWPEY